MALALQSLRTDQPRVLVIVLNNYDALAHMGAYRESVAMLKRYDDWIGEIVAEQKKQEVHGAETALFVMPDHGRDKSLWRDHGPGIAGSELIWLFVRGPIRSPWPTVSVALRPRVRVSPHLDLGPTIERFFGFEPTKCPECGRPLDIYYEYF